MKYPYVAERVLDHFPELKPTEVVKRLRYSSFVSLPKRYMYFEVPKAACTQMKELLRTIEAAPPLKLLVAGPLEVRRDMFVHARINVPLPSLVDLDEACQREVLESSNFLRMTVVRNPYARLLSAWRDKVVPCPPTTSEVYRQIRGHLPDIHNKSLISFGEFVDYLENGSDSRDWDSHWRRQIDHLFFPAMNFSVVATVEQLPEGLRLLEQHLGLPQPLVATGRNISIRFGADVYTEALADRVYSLYRSDFEALGYDKGSWPCGSQKAEKDWTRASVPLKEYLDEIIERNVLLLNLYKERQALEAELRRISKLRSFRVLNGLSTCRSALRRLAGSARGWARSIGLKGQAVPGPGSAQGVRIMSSESRAVKDRSGPVTFPTDANFR